MRYRKVSSPLPVLYTPWDWAKNLYGVAAHRDCSFHSEFNQLVSVALIVGSPRVAVSHYASQCSPDFPLSLFDGWQLCFVHLELGLYSSMFFWNCKWGKSKYKVQSSKYKVQMMIHYFYNYLPPCGHLWLPSGVPSFTKKENKFRLYLSLFILGLLFVFAHVTCRF